MKALVHTAPYQFEYRDVPVPVAGDDDILIRVKTCGICGSDVHGFTGKTGRRIPPIIMGHEASGIVEHAGTKVKRFKTGDRVTFDSIIFCGQCYYCRRQKTNLCINKKVVGASTESFKINGAMAEFVVVPEKMVFKIPDDISFVQAALVEPFSIGFHAVNLTPLSVNDTIAIVGAGPIGLYTLMAFRAKGAKKIIVIDVNEERLRFAKKLGADYIINPGKTDVSGEIAKITDGLRCDVACEAVGVESTFQTAISITKNGGYLTVIGNSQRMTSVCMQDIVTREISIRGSSANGGALEYTACIDMISRGAVDVTSLVSEKVPLSNGAAAFEELHKAERFLLKVILEV